EPIGEGGFGAVYRAEQPVLGREAVIKVLHGKLRTREHYAHRFLREARLASKLDHPYAAHVYAFGVEPDGQMWIAMELVRGTPLDQLLVAQGPIPLERFVPLLDRICEVVHTAHEAGIVHRDLKPANVMVIARAGRLLPKLLDFGIAKLHDDRSTPAAAAVAPAAIRSGAGELTEDGVALGSPSYMAPEQWSEAAAADARAELYALGVLAVEGRTGHPPFGHGDRRPGGRPRDRVPPSLGPQLPRALDAVMAKAMAGDPADRYPDALAFASAFRDASGFTADAETLPKLD